MTNFYFVPKNPEVKVDPCLNSSSAAEHALQAYGLRVSFVLVYTFTSLTATAKAW